MAGVVPKRSTSGRKQWDILGHRSSLKGLRSQMASDGCSESQVVLAKQLLDEQCEMNADARENEELGVYWLIQASEQGNLEATSLLRSCLDTGKGITELNYLDVKNCLEMPQDEKLARKAAREMFACLANGGEYITTNQLRKKMLALEEEGKSADRERRQQLDFGDFNRDECLRFRAESVRRNEKLTQDSLVAAAVDYTHGNLPIVSRTLSLTAPNPDSLNHVPLFQRSILHPLLSLQLFYVKLVALLGQRLAFMTEWCAVLLMCVYVIVSADNALYLLPLALYYVTFAVMVAATCQMLQLRRDYHDFRLWSGLFICYSGGEVNAADAEYQYIRNNLRPYYLFFCSLILNLAVYAVVVKQWLPQSELTVLSFLLTFVTLVGFMHKRRGRVVPNYLVLLSFGVNVLAKYPYDTDPVVAQNWRFLDLHLPTYASYVIGNGIEFCINFKVLLYVTIPLILARIAAKENWRGTFKYLPSHCVTLGWLQICIISAQGATFYGLLRGSLALVGIILFVPLAGLTSVVVPLISVLKWFVLSDWLLVAMVPVAVVTWVVVCRWGAHYTRAFTALQMSCVAVAIFLVLRWQLQTTQQEQYYQAKEVSWDVYQRFCHQPIWQEENVALAQVKCAELATSQVNWDGYINDIKIRTITNRMKSVFDNFPPTLRHFLYCFYGTETTSDDCHLFPAAIRDECLSFYGAVKAVNPCTLAGYNTYTFEVTVRMTSGIWGKTPEVVLLLEDCFKNFSLALKPNDHIWFKGALRNDKTSPDGFLGGLKTNVKVEELGCFACANRELSNVKCAMEGFSASGLKNGVVAVVKFLMNVLLYPMFSFK